MYLSFSGIHRSFQPLCLADWSHGTSSLVLTLCLVDAIVHQSAIGLHWDLHQFPYNDLRTFPLTLIIGNDLFFTFSVNFMLWMSLSCAMCMCRWREVLPPFPATSSMMFSWGHTTSFIFIRLLFLSKFLFLETFQLHQDSPLIALALWWFPKENFEGVETAVTESG